MTSGLSKYLNEQVAVFLNVKQQKLSSLKHKQRIFNLSKKFLYNVIFMKDLCYLSF